MAALSGSASVFFHLLNYSLTLSGPFIQIEIVCLFILLQLITLAWTESDAMVALKNKIFNFLRR